MDELKKYTDELFAHEPKTTEVRDLKEEIYSNLLAKQQDLIGQGFLEAAAAKTKASISTLEGILEGKQLTYINRFKTECWQHLLLYGVIWWILSIPTIIMGMLPFAIIVFLVIVVFGLIYLNHKNNGQVAIAFIEPNRYKAMVKAAWLIWLIFFIVVTVSVSAVTFGSDLWFARPVRITGPYELATLAVHYYIPATTILLPVALSSLPKILARNERSELNG